MRNHWILKIFRGAWFLRTNRMQPGKKGPYGSNLGFLGEDIHILRQTEVYGSTVNSWLRKTLMGRECRNQQSLVLVGFLSRPAFSRSCMAKAVQYFPQVRSQKKGGNHADIYDDMPWIPWIVQLALIQVLVGPLWRDPPVTCEACTFPGCLHSSRRCVWPVWGPWLIAGLVSWLKADFIQECHWKRVKGFWSGRRFFPHKSLFIIFLRWTSILIVILEGSRCPIYWQAAHALRLANCERSSLLLLTWGEASGEPATGTSCVLERGLLGCSSQADYFIALYVYKYTVYIYILNICI